MEKYITVSDIGGVLCGNKDFSVVVPNGIGDGDTQVIICNITEYDSIRNKYGNKLSFVTSLKGKFNIYIYDCCKMYDDDVVATLDGEYLVYNIGDYATVIFEKLIRQ